MAFLVVAKWLQRLQASHPLRTTSMQDGRLGGKEASLYNSLMRESYPVQKCSATSSYCSLARLSHTAILGHLSSLKKRKHRAGDFLKCLQCLLCSRKPVSPFPTCTHIHTHAWGHMQAHTCTHMHTRTGSYVGTHLHWSMLFPWGGTDPFSGADPGVRSESTSCSHTDSGIEGWVSCELFPQDLPPTPPPAPSGRRCPLELPTEVTHWPGYEPDPGPWFQAKIAGCEGRAAPPSSPPAGVRRCPRTQLHILFLSLRLFSRQWIY